MTQSLDRLSLSTVRMLAADAVEQAKSGHPGMPLGAAPMAYVLWTRFLRHNPADPAWPDRDRFILSAGHGSALLYALLHLTGYDLPLEEVKNFRQWGSRTPGHPEYGHTPGVEVTTGPLGQGFAMGVGMALAEQRLAREFNRPGLPPVVDHWTYAIVSDGDLMEGVASEATSLAGHLGLGRMVYLYDDNRITIDGGTDISFSENVQLRFEACNWQVLRVDDGEDLAAIEQAIQAGREESLRPTLIMVRTRIGHGSPKAGTSTIHGTPLGPDMAATRRFYDWPETPFHIPAEALGHLRTALDRGRERQTAWQQRLADLDSRFPGEAELFHARMRGELPRGWDSGLAELDWGGKGPATRVASGKIMNAIAPHLPAFMGGSADLAASNMTWLDSAVERNIHFGIREHAMAAMVNGMALHGGILPYCATFLVFSDYMRGAMRLSALMGAHVVYVLTHDSIAVGEDGPTHQPVEHVNALRLIPNLLVLRPAEARETVAAWRLAVTTRSPSALILSRQNLPLIEGLTDGEIDAGVARGGYVLSACDGPPQLILIASGSEVSLALAAKRELAVRGHARVRVVSMPGRELFERQPADYRDQVLPPGVTTRLAIEAGSTMGWHRWVGDRGAVVGLDRFGASAPGGRVLEEYGFTVDNVVDTALGLLR